MAADDGKIQPDTERVNGLIADVLAVLRRYVERDDLRQGAEVTCALATVTAIVVQSARAPTAQRLLYDYFEQVLKQELERLCPTLPARQ